MRFLVYNFNMQCPVVMIITYLPVKYPAYSEQHTSIQGISIKIK